MELHYSGHQCPFCRRQYAQTCNGSGTDARCATKVKHRHCLCFMPMAPNAKQCEMCIREGCVPLIVDLKIWDGETYPSFRRKRTQAPHSNFYVYLYKAVNGLVTPFQRVHQ